MGCPHSKDLGVFVVEATVMACELLAGVLSRTSDLRVLAWEVDSKAALATVTRINADVALVSCDLQDGPRKGLTLVSELHRSNPKLHSVVLLNTADREGVVEAFRAGAHGVWSREAGLNDLPKCVQRVGEGQVWASSNELEYLLDILVQTPPMRVLTDTCYRLLTDREQSIVRLVADGMSNHEVAYHLRISEHTVKNHLFHIFDKIGVSSRVELVLCALSSSIADPKYPPQGDRAAAAISNEHRPVPDRHSHT